MLWIRRAGRAVLTGLLWAMAWSPIGPIIGYIVDRDGKMDEPWIAVGVFPAFMSGLIFCAVLAIAERGRRFDELSLARIVRWGALSGALVGALPFALGDTGGKPIPLWLFGFPLYVGLLSASSAAGNLLLARKAEFNLMDDTASVG